MICRSDTLLPVDVFESFRNKCLEIYELDTAHFLSELGLVWKVAFKKKGIKLELFTDNHMLLMVEKGIRSVICHAMHRYAKANNKYTKNDNKDNELSFLMYQNDNVSKVACKWF